MHFIPKYTRSLFLSSSLFFFFSPSLLAQNLVPNPSFESFNACPDTFVGPGGSNITAADYWYNPGDFSPDYLNACDTNITYPKFGVPVNQYGTQSARTGFAYAGIITFFKDTSAREYIEAKLTDTLIASQTYEVSFYVSLGGLSKYAANDIGAYFSDTSIYLPISYQLPFTPQIQNNPFSNPLTDTSQWIQVIDTFIAQGTEQYIIIGNFKNNANTDTTNVDDGNPNNLPWAYYYIDDISVDFHAGMNDISMDDKIKIYPNPSHDYVQINTDNIFIDKVEVINILGEILFHQSKPLQNNIRFDFSNQAKGIYLLKLDLNNGSVYTKKIIIN